MLRSLEIPRERWPEFLRTFNRLVAARSVRIEVMGRRLGDQQMAERLPFQGLDWDEKDSALTITVGDSGAELGHRIVGPTNIYLGQDETGEFEWLAIEERGEAG